MTELVYLTDTYLFEIDAKVCSVENTENGIAVILDKTIFYPQGGGQPYDLGEIVSGTNSFVVESVRLDEEGTVWHFGKFIYEELFEGDTVALYLNKTRRVLNSRLHSAGHLIDCAISDLKINSLIPMKGFHFSEGPYVEYDGVVENTNDLISILEEKVNILVNLNLPVEINTSYCNVDKININAPVGKTPRFVNFLGFKPCGCGGTHVNYSSEIGKIIIRKIKSKKGKTKISYSIL